MKIFNWVHRRFYNKEKIGDIVELEAECNDDVFEGWGGGILSIGTFGYDHPASLKDDDEEIAPAVLQIISDEVEIIEEEEVDYLEGIIEKEEIGGGLEYVMMEKRERTTLADLFMTTTTTNTAHHDSDDQDNNMKKQQHQQPCTTTTTTLNNKHKSKPKFTKKKLLKLDVDAQPITKLTKVMRRMLKRKIHPEVAAGLDMINDHLLPTQDAII